MLSTPDSNEDINHRLVVHYLAAREYLSAESVAQVQDVITEMLKWFARVSAGDYWITFPPLSTSYTLEIENQILLRGAREYSKPKN